MIFVGPGTQWKSQALAMTISEIPKISTCGQESGDYKGYGRHIYTAPGAPRSKISSKYIKPGILLVLFVRLTYLNHPTRSNCTYNLARWKMEKFFRH